MVNNVYDLVTRTMEQEFPGRVAFRWVEDATGTVKEKTYAEYAQDIRRAAAWFARNIPEVEGKRVVLLSRNCYEYGVNTFGAVLAGAVPVTMNQKKDLGRTELGAGAGRVCPHPERWGGLRLP